MYSTLKCCVQLYAASKESRRSVGSGIPCSLRIDRVPKEWPQLRNGGFGPGKTSSQCYRTLRRRPSLADQTAGPPVASGEEEQVKSKGMTSSVALKQDEQSSLVEYAMPNELTLPSGVVSGVRGEQCAGLFYAFW